MSDAQSSAVEEANTYTDENLNNYYNKTVTNNIFVEGPYQFNRVLDKSVVNDTPLVPDVNMGIAESSVTAKVTYKAVLWKNSIDGTYKITMDLYSSSLSPSCTLKPKAVKIGLISYASAWRMPSVYTGNCCANATALMRKWGASNWRIGEISGTCFTATNTNIGILNANGISQAFCNSSDDGNISLTVSLMEMDTDHTSDNLPVYGFKYHVEVVSNQTTL